VREFGFTQIEFPLEPTSRLILQISLGDSALIRGAVSSRCFSSLSGAEGRCLCVGNLRRAALFLNLTRVRRDMLRRPRACVIAQPNILRDLRVAEVIELDVQRKNGKIEAYGSRIRRLVSSMRAGAKPRFDCRPRSEGVDRS
jgi:hypothetical protein